MIWDKINLFLALTSGTLLMSGAWLVPSWLLWIMLGISVWISIFHYLKTRKQPYLHMVAVAFYVSGLVGVWIYTFWDEQDFIVQPLIVMRVVYVLFLFIMLGLVAAWWRAVTAFQHKRGNVDKEQLVRTDEPLSEKWRNIQRRFRGEKTENQDIYLILGDEVEER